ncbi:MAG TPA: fibronectin type III domain-containing protein [Mycobacteriales bacterium]
MPVRGSLVALIAGGLVLLPAAAAWAVDPVYAPGDATAPSVVSVAVVPGELATALEPAAVVVTAHLSDAGTGVAQVVVRLGDAEPVTLSPLNGDPRNGDWSAAAVVPRGTEAGLLTAYVQARDGVGNVTAVERVVARVADARPDAPASLAATPGDAAIALTWAPPPANGGSPVTGYAVTADAVGDAAPPVAVTAPAGSTGTVLDGLATDGRYVVRVAAVNAAGTGPAATTDVLLGAVGTVTPSAPRAAVATPANGAADVTWVPPVSDGRAPVTGYELRAPGAPAAVTVAAGVTTARVPGLVNGVPYVVTVTPLSDLGPGLAATAEVTPRTTPSAPAVVETVAGDRSATVRWTAPLTTGGDAVHLYVVTAHPTGTQYVLPGTARSATVGGLANGAAVTFTVTARNDAGDSPASAPGAVTTPRQPVRLTVLSTPRTRVTYGEGSHAAARLTSLAGTPIAGRRVELQARVVPSTEWRTVSAGTTDASGYVRVSAALPATAGLRLRHPGDTLATAHAWLATVYVAPRVTATRSVTTARVGSAFTVTGTVAPGHPAGSRVTVQRSTSTGWVNVAEGAMTTTSAYRISWRPRTAGTFTLRVVKHADADHVTGYSHAWSQYVAPEGADELARQIRANTRIALDGIHVSGRIDGATARANLADLSVGLRARRSSYEGAPGGTTLVDVRLLRALRRMGQLGRVTVTEVAGGSHSPGSTHYSGRGLDIRLVNGVPVSSGTSYGWVVQVCRSYGAARVFHPGYDPYGGHQGHVHCDWS